MNGLLNRANHSIAHTHTHTHTHTHPHMHMPVYGAISSSSLILKPHTPQPVTLHLWEKNLTCVAWHTDIAPHYCEMLHYTDLLFKHMSTHTIFDTVSQLLHGLLTATTHNEWDGMLWTVMVEECCYFVATLPHSYHSAPIKSVSVLSGLSAVIPTALRYLV